MTWKDKVERASFNFVCSDTSTFLLYSLDSGANSTFSVLQHASSYP